jgi:hypothetical protein
MLQRSVYRIGIISKEGVMMKNKKLGFLAIGWLAFMSLSNEAQALPMFGKQTGLDCTVRAHTIWPPRAFAFGQLTHQHLATARIHYLAS